MARRNSIEKPGQWGHISCACGKISLAAIHHLEEDAAKEFAPDFQLAHSQIDCQIELKLQTETSLREIQSGTRLFRQVGLRILRVDDDRRGPLVSLIDELQQVTFRPLREITNRTAHPDIGGVDKELPRSADTAFRRGR